jgi:TetR/AcrR family transcriptional regulator, lmrAB and yxaGH operons repressor
MTVVIPYHDERHNAMEAIVPTSNESRRRMIRSAAVLFRSKGVDGTAFSDVIAHSGAPRGSIYHHFPGGKAELAEEATRYAGEYVAAALAAALAEDDPVATLTGFSAAVAKGLEQTRYQDGCPVVAAALEGPRTPGASAAAAEAIRSWESLLAEAFERNGVAPGRARSIATTVVAGIEGAIVMARAEGSSEPLERVSAELASLARAALADAH